MDKPLKKVVILSYYFPPANFAGSYRVASWAQYFAENGYFPIIITRGWQKNQTDTWNKSPNTGIEIEKNEQNEIHKLPYKGNLRDKLYSSNKSGFIRVLGRISTFFEIASQSFSNFYIPYKNLYTYAAKYLEEHPEVDRVLISGRPFLLFKFGFLLKKKFPRIEWIADYRDEWNTHQWINKQSLYFKVITFFERRLEKRCLQNVLFFTTCSKEWVESISYFIHKPGFEIMNGFEKDLSGPKANPGKEIKLVHNGTCYASQPIEIFLEGYKKFITEYPEVNIKLYFIGIDSEASQRERIRSYLKGFEKYFETTKRVPKDEIVRLQQEADILIMFGTHGIKGHHSSKIFEYMAVGKPILLCPAEKGVILDLVNEYGNNIKLDSSPEVSRFLLNYSKNESYRQTVDNRKRSETLFKYSRKYLSGQLCELIDKSYFMNPQKHQSSFVRDLIFSGLYFFGITKFLRYSKKSDTVTTLCFHRVSYEADPAYPSMQPHIFKGIIKYCLKHYTFISPDQVHSKTPKPKLLMTFDDGYADFIDYVLPILEEYNLPCIMSIVSDTVQTKKPFWTQRIGALINSSVLTAVGLTDPLTNEIILPSVEDAEMISLMLFDKLITLTRDERELWLSEQENGRKIYYPEMLDEKQIISLDKKGVIFASHSKSHSYLPKEAEQGNLQFIINELVESKKYIENILGKTCTVYAAPSGRLHTVVAKLAVDKAGYKYLLSTNEDFYSPTEIEATKEIPRILMYRNNIAENIFRLEGFHKKIQ